MAFRQVDPASLHGEALRRWYLRSAADIEQERQAAAAKRHDVFFGGAGAADPDPGISRKPKSPAGDVDPGFSRGPTVPVPDVDPGISWSPVGPNRWRGARIASGHRRQTEYPPEVRYDDAVLDRGLASPGDGGEFIEIGSKAPQHRRGWARREGTPWPTVPETQANFHVSHIIAKADDGPDTLENIEPEHPVEHMKRHRENGDFSRWGKRGGRPSTVAPRGGPRVRGIGLLGAIPSITGILSGNIRIDSFDNFASDMLGFPSQEDQRKTFEGYQRALTPGWKPGDPISV